MAKLQPFHSKQQMSTNDKKGLANDILSGGKTPYPAEPGGDGDDDDDDGGDGAVTNLPGKFASMHIKAHANGLSCETCHETPNKKDPSFPTTHRAEHVFNNPDEAIKHVTKHIRGAYKK